MRARESRSVGRIRRLLEESRLRHAARNTQARTRRPWRRPFSWSRPKRQTPCLRGGTILARSNTAPILHRDSRTRRGRDLFPAGRVALQTIPGFRPIELARLWQADDSERPLSQFLAASLRWLRQLGPDVDCVFSYADPAQKNDLTKRPHNGTIYQATNFAYVGESRATDYWRTPKGEIISSPVCYRRFKTKSRERFKR